MLDKSENNTERFDYMHPDVAAGLPHFDVPLIRATAENFAEYGTIVTDFMNHRVPITKWPHSRWHLA